MIIAKNDIDMINHLGRGIHVFFANNDGGIYYKPETFQKGATKDLDVWVGKTPDGPERTIRRGEIELIKVVL